MSFLVFPLVDQPNHFVSLAIVKVERPSEDPIAFVGLFTGSTPFEIASQIEKFDPTLGPVEICSGSNGNILPNISITWTHRDDQKAKLLDSKNEFLVKHNNEVLAPRYIYSQAVPKFNLPLSSNCSISQFSSSRELIQDNRSLSYGVNWLNFLILILVLIILILIIYYFFFKSPISCDQVCPTRST